jgi:hypothetical protein
LAGSGRSQACLGSTAASEQCSQAPKAPCLTPLALPRTPTARSELQSSAREVRVITTAPSAQRWSLPAYVARPEAAPGEAANDFAVRSNTYNRDLWRALTELSTAFMRAAGKVQWGWCGVREGC